jgi:hypothetical protein
MGDARKRMTPQTKARQRAANKRWYVKNKNKVLAWHKAYRATPAGRARQMFQGVAARSKARGETTDITIGWLQERLEAGICEETGLPFDLQQSGLKQPYAPSIDRIDNARGYSQDNCRVILWALNVAFNSWGEDVFNKISKAWFAKHRGAVIVLKVAA